MEEKPKKPTVPRDLILTVTLPEGTPKITSALGKVYQHSLSDEQAARLKVNSLRRTYEVGKVISVHPQRRQLTVQVPGNRVAWVERVLLGKEPVGTNKPKYEVEAPKAEATES